MPSRSIFRTELNAIVQTLLMSGLDQTGFEFSKDFSKRVFDIQLPLQITHRESGFYFIVDFERGEWNTTSYSTSSFPTIAADDEIEYFTTWSAVISNLGAWLERVSNELSQPDPWLLLNEGNLLADNIPSEGASLEKFNEEELSWVRGLLDSIRDFLISETQPTSDQLKLINEKLTYLEESARRQNKQDWAHTAIGVVVTIAIGLAMAPDQANKLFQLTSALLRSIFFKLLTAPGT